MSLPLGSCHRLGTVSNSLYMLTRSLGQIDYSLSIAAEPKLNQLLRSLSQEHWPHWSKWGAFTDLCTLGNTSCSKGPLTSRMRISNCLTFFFFFFLVGMSLHHCHQHFKGNTDILIFQLFLHLSLYLSLMIMSCPDH